MEPRRNSNSKSTAWIISIDPVALWQLSKFPRKHQRQIKNSIERMKSDLFQGNVKQLQGDEWQGRYRKRIGRYRLIFAARHHTGTVKILDIELRNEKTYRK